MTTYRGDKWDLEGEPQWKIIPIDSANLRDRYPADPAAVGGSAGAPAAAAKKPEHIAIHFRFTGPGMLSFVCFHYNFSNLANEECTQKNR